MHLHYQVRRTVLQILRNTSKISLFQNHEKHFMKCLVLVDASVFARIEIGYNFRSHKDLEKIQFMNFSKKKLCRQNHFREYAC